MPTFRVLRRVDAFTDYVTDVEAANAVEAAKLASASEEKCEWRKDGVHEFDARVFYALDNDGYEIAETEVGDL